MSITVRVIFWGLIGFVPNPEGQKGLTALLVDTAQAQRDDAVEEKCKIQDHLSAVYLFDGTCEGEDCTRPRGVDNDAIAMGLRSEANPLQLGWLLDHEDLKLVGDETKKMSFHNPFMGFSSKIAPASERQAQSFFWVPSLATLAEEAGVVRKECIEGKPPCPLNARFTLQGGEAGACHLIHQTGITARDRKRYVRIFDYDLPGRQKFQRAVADAVLVTLTFKGDSVLLVSQSLQGHDGSPAQARLWPDAHGTVTLVVAHFPRNARLNEATHLAHTSCVPPHSDILLRLLSTGPKTKGIRRADSGKVKRLDPGSCEAEAISLAKLFKDSSPEVPHATTACDGIKYPQGRGGQ